MDEGVNRAGSGRGRRWIVAAAVAAAFVAAWLALASCASSGTGTPEEREARAQALVESGNEAYRRGDYRLAVKRYSAATVVRADDAAAHYGMGMALAKLGRDEEARAAYARARELSQGRP